MKYNIKVYNIQEDGQRKDANGNPHQEDSIFPAKDKATEKDRLFILCDGMGGHDAGEVASQTVCAAMSSSILAAQPDTEGPFTEEILQKGISDAFFALDDKDTGATKKMGTTMTALKLYSGGAMIAHMGDSRVYHIRPGRTAAETKILFQTRDHSLVNDLIAIGELTEEEARTSRQKNVITRAMQPHMDRRPKADIKFIPDEKDPDIKSGDYFYLCSDGMLEHMENEQLCYFFSESAGTDEEKVQKLISATLENRDNHTAIIVHILDVFLENIPTENSQETQQTAKAPKLMAEVHDEEEVQNNDSEINSGESSETEVDNFQKNAAASDFSHPIKSNSDAVMPAQSSIQHQQVADKYKQRDNPRKGLSIRSILAGFTIAVVVIGGFFGIRGCNKSDKEHGENNLEQIIPAKEANSSPHQAPNNRQPKEELTHQPDKPSQPSQSSNQASSAAANAATEFVDGSGHPNGSPIQTSIQTVTTTDPKQDATEAVSSDEDKINEVVNPGKKR